MEISVVTISNFNESLVASGLPMKTAYDEKWFENELDNLYNCEDVTETPHFKRACRLAANSAGSGHDNFLSGIMVSANITATVKWWEQFQRYHFKQIVSSMSTMHRLRQMAIDGTIRFNVLTNPDMVAAFMRLAKDKSVTDEELSYSCPMGLELTAQITTNYLQLKTMWRQRHNHKLTEWREVCQWIEKLPFARQLIVGAAI